MEPLIKVAEGFRYQVCKERILAPDPLTSVDALADKLESVWVKIVKLSVNHTFGHFELLTGHCKQIVAGHEAKVRNPDDGLSFAII
jgi:hypothetical protein